MHCVVASLSLISILLILINNLLRQMVKRITRWNLDDPNPLGHTVVPGSQTSELLDN